ncbi:hypothetical protein BCV73_08780 [Paenibacillus sp. SSG-1]|uniref:hypothetical protein n=1 Tax=Paenibacillus sp. SSG-1 TaxID=1443669 RepID=UPI000B7ED308|nr:hypothetical protein [Paenibacillus sp. SSG-1]OXL83162.1 hypothetical protein BCV73_08780 [Paenibacillus sp. SSG-1]
MIQKVFIFEVDGVRVSTPKMYKQEPSKEQVLKDIQDWFFANHAMWFAVKENGAEKNLEDWI